MKTWKMVGMLCGLMAGMVLSVQASVIRISVTGTANSTDWGYVAGQSYSFHWTVNEHFENNSHSVFYNNGNFWEDEWLDETPVFTDVSGDGLVGAWERPMTRAHSPSSGLWAYNANTSLDSMKLRAADDTSVGIGLSAGGYQVDELWCQVYTGAGLFAFDALFISPTHYFEDYAGTYEGLSGILALNSTSGAGIAFSPKSLTIAAVPEPASLGSLLLAAGGLLGIRRFFATV